MHHTDKNPQLSLANQAQFLLINTPSAQWLLDCIPKDELHEDLQGIIRRFRPNFVITTETAFEENGFTQIKIGNTLFKVGHF